MVPHDSKSDLPIEMEKEKKNISWKLPLCTGSECDPKLDITVIYLILTKSMLTMRSYVSFLDFLPFFPFTLMCLTCPLAKRGIHN